MKYPQKCKFFFNPRKVVHTKTNESTINMKSNKTIQIITYHNQCYFWYTKHCGKIGSLMYARSIPLNLVFYILYNKQGSTYQLGSGYYDMWINQEISHYTVKMRGYYPVLHRQILKSLRKIMKSAWRYSFCCFFYIYISSQSLFHVNVTPCPLIIFLLVLMLFNRWLRCWRWRCWHYFVLEISF